MRDIFRLKACALGNPRQQRGGGKRRIDENMRIPRRNKHRRRVSGAYLAFFIPKRMGRESTDGDEARINAHTDAISLCADHAPYE